MIQALAAGPDGNLWFSDTDAEADTILGRMTTVGAITDLSSAGGGPITRGPGGKLRVAGGGIGPIDQNGNVAAYPVPAGWAIHSLTEGPDGNLWFTAVRSVDTAAWDDIGRMTPTGSVTMFRIPTFNAVPDGIAAGPDGNVWFGEHAGKIGRITPSGKFTEFPTHASGRTGADNLIAGPDHAMWFTDGGQQAIGRITLAGQVSEFPAPRPAWSVGASLAFGDSHTLWFTEKEQGVIVRATIVQRRA